MKKELLKKLDLALGKDLYYSPQVNEKVKWFGDKYAGFYVAPRLLNENSIVYSFGVGTNISFDLQLIEQFGCKVYAFDPTPKSIAWIKNQEKNPSFNFFDFGIDIKDGMKSFFLPENPEHVSATIFNKTSTGSEKQVSVDVPMKSFATILSMLGHKKIDVLKLDIEGSEYVVIEDILKSDVEIVQILVEFHHRMPYIDDGLNKTKHAVEVLNKYGYKITKVANSLEEYSFIKMSN